VGVPLTVVFVPSSVQWIAWNAPLTVRLQLPAWQVPLEAHAVPSGALPESTQTAAPVEQEVTPVRHAVATAQAWPAVHEDPRHHHRRHRQRQRPRRAIPGSAIASSIVASLTREGASEAVRLQKVCLFSSTPEVCQAARKRATRAGRETVCELSLASAEYALARVGESHTV
jgi:hypothetical protein